MTTKLERVTAAFRKSYPDVQIDGMFCLVTGAYIGSSWEINELIDSLEGDAEEIADDVAMRIFASMRPSLFWNKMRVESLDDMSKSRPQELMAFLLNRLFSPVGHVSNYIVEHHDRIRNFAHISRLPSDSDFTDSLQMLIELDAKMNLKQISAKFTAAQFWLCESWSDFLQIFADLYDSQMKLWHKLQAESRYVQANPQSKFAYVNSVIRSGFVTPKKVDGKVKAVRSTTPETLSEKAKAKASKAKEADFFSALFDAVHESKLGMQEVKAAQPIAPVTIAPKVLTQAPMFFSAKPKEN